MRKVLIVDPGDEKTVVIGEILMKKDIDNLNKELKKNGKKLIVYKLRIEGITQAALTGDSFLAAASFQEATKVLTEASTAGSIDNLEGIKENMILGRMTPIGTHLIQRNIENSNSSK